MSPAGATTIYVYDGSNIEEELNANGTLGERYTYGPGVDEPLVGQRQPKIFFYEADGLGSVTSLTDPTGAVAATYTYDSFGFLTNSTGSATNWFRYTAREFDSDTALYYYRARYYDPTVGRFISEDPIRFTGGRNFYVYVGNDSSSRTDPFGLCPKVDCSQPAPAPPPAPPGVDVNATIQQASAVAQTQVADPQTGVSFDSTTAWLYSQFQTGGQAMVICTAFADGPFGLWPCLWDYPLGRESDRGHPQRGRHSRMTENSSPRSGQ